MKVILYVKEGPQGWRQWEFECEKKPLDLSTVGSRGISVHDHDDGSEWFIPPHQILAIKVGGEVGGEEQGESRGGE